MNTAPSTYLPGDQRARPDAYLAAMTDLLDPYTRWRISRLGDWTGARCLLVGPGGNLAGWLADQAGQHGRVTVADLKPTRIPRTPAEPPRPEALLIEKATGEQLDLADPGRWPARMTGAHDLLVVRPGLSYLKTGPAILERLIWLVRHEGMVLVETWEAPPCGHEMITPAERVWNRLYHRFRRHVTSAFLACEMDLGCAHQLRLAMDRELADVETTIHSSHWKHASPGLEMLTAMAEHMRPSLAEVGLKVADHDRLTLLLKRPDLVIYGDPLYCLSGRRTIDTAADSLDDQRAGR